MVSQDGVAALQLVGAAALRLYLQTQMASTKPLSSYAGKTENWADARDQPSPPPPAQSQDYVDDPAGDYPHDDVDRRGGYDRPYLPIPTQPPFTAFLGNLKFQTIEADVEELFEYYKLPISNLRFVYRENSFSGIAYVDFENAEDLEYAIEKISGVDLLGRAIRIDVAGAKREHNKRGGGRYDNRHDDDRRGGGGAGGGRSGYDDTRKGSHRYEKRGYEDDRRGGRSYQYEDDRRGGGSQYDNERPPAEPRDHPVDDVDAQASPPVDSEAPPKERRKLNLLPRGTSSSGAAATEPATQPAPAKPKPNPFGAAKPREEVLAARGVKVVEDDIPAPKLPAPKPAQAAAVSVEQDDLTPAAQSSSASPSASGSVPSHSGDTRDFGRSAAGPRGRDGNRRDDHRPAGRDDYRRDDNRQSGRDDNRQGGRDDNRGYHDNNRRDDNRQGGRDHNRRGGGRDDNRRGGGRRAGGGGGRNKTDEAGWTSVKGGKSGAPNPPRKPNPLERDDEKPIAAVNAFDLLENDDPLAPQDDQDNRPDVETSAPLKSGKSKAKPKTADDDDF